MTELTFTTFRRLADTIISRISIYGDSAVHFRIDHSYAYIIATFVILLGETVRFSNNNDFFFVIKFNETKIKTINFLIYKIIFQNRSMSVRTSVS